MKDLLNKILKKIDEKKRKLDFFRPLPPELIKNLEEWFKIELTYNSNAIEGNTLSKKETALVIEKGLTIGGKSIIEHLEVINYAFALDYIKGLVGKKKEDLSIKDILNIHFLILKKIDDKNAGKFRNIAVKISGSQVRLPEPIKVPDLMNDFIIWLHKTMDHTVKVAADVHFKLVTIHPFVDGNGRTARLLMNLILMQNGYPPAIIKNKERLLYISCLEKAQLTGDLKDYYKFIYKSVDASLDIYLEAAEKSI